jgi:hypothetical protein
MPSSNTAASSMPINELPHLILWSEVWTLMKQGRGSEVPSLLGVDRYVAGYVTREIGKLAGALKRESRLSNWFASCGLDRANVRKRGSRAELSFSYKKGSDGRHHWVCGIQSHVNRARKIQRKWAYFRSCQVKEVQEILDLADWVVEEPDYALRRLRERIKHGAKKQDERRQARDRKIKRVFDDLESKLPMVSSLDQRQAMLAEAVAQAHKLQPRPRRKQPTERKTRKNV